MTAAPPPSGDAITRLRAHRPAASPSIERVIAHVLDDPDAASRSTIQELASAIGCSESTVIRTAQLLGYDGYTELRIDLARASAAALIEYAEIGQPADTSELLDRAATASAAAIRTAFSVVQPSAVDAVVDALRSARRVALVAVGTSNAIALDAAYRLQTIGIDARFPADAHMQHTEASMLGPGDLALAISHTGRTRETLLSMQAAREAGAPIALLTSFYRTPATELADHALVTGPSNNDGREGSMATRIAHTALVDALLIALRLAEPDRSLATSRRWTDAIERHGVHEHRSTR